MSELHMAATREVGSVDSASGATLRPTGLTTAELGVTELVVEGLTNKQIAERLFISRYTVDSHLRSIFKKVGVGSRLELTRVALSKRLVAATWPVENP
jgi:DNA-binding NarL/FixJ family response regulator